MRLPFLAAALLFAGPALAQSPPAQNAGVAQASSIRVEHVWARATPPGAATGAVYMTLTGTGAPDRLVSISTPVAAMAGLHESVNDNGVMRMRPVEGLALQPGAPVSLKPGGLHVMLMQLKHPLKAGDSFPVTLVFAHAAPLTVTATVVPVGAREPGMDHTHMNMQTPMDMPKE
jgi:copper(I)-binding protein